MKTTAKELAMPGLGYAYALGMLALTTSCTASPNPSAQNQESEKVTQVRDSSQVGTVTIKIDASSMVYPITQGAV